MTRESRIRLLSLLLVASFAAMSLGSSCNDSNPAPPPPLDQISVPCKATANQCTAGVNNGVCMGPLAPTTFPIKPPICQLAPIDLDVACQQSLCSSTACFLPYCDPTTCVAVHTGPSTDGCSPRPGTIPIGTGSGNGGGTGGSGGSGGATQNAPFLVFSIPFTAANVEQSSSSTLPAGSPFPFPTTDGDPVSINADNNSENLWFATNSNTTPSNENIVAVNVQAGGADTIQFAVPPPPRSTLLTSVHLGEQVAFSPPDGTLVVTGGSSVTLTNVKPSGPSLIRTFQLGGAVDADLSSTFTIQPDVAAIGTSPGAAGYLTNFQTEVVAPLDPIQPLSVSIGTQRFWVLGKDQQGDAVLTQLFPNGTQKPSLTMGGVTPVKIDGGSGADDGSSPGVLVAAVITNPNVGELRLFTGGNLQDPTEPNTRINLNGEPRALKVFEISSTGPLPQDAGITQNQDAGAVDTRQYAWVLVQTGGGSLVARCYNLGSRMLVASANIGSYQAVDMTLGTRLFPVPPNGNTGGTSTSFLHVLVSAP